MFSNNDKLYLETTDMPTLKTKLKEAEKLSKELASILNDISNYRLEFKMKEEKVLDEIPPHTFPLINN